MRLDRLFDRGTVAKLVSLLLLLALLGLADGYLLVRLAETVGVYFSLAIEGATAILALGVLGSSVNSKFRRMMRHIRRGNYPGRLYAETLVILCALALLLMPGLVSDAFGVILFVLPLRTFFAWIVARLWDAELQDAHEYLKMKVFSDRC